MPRQLVDGTYYTLLEILNYQSPDTVVLELFWYVLETELDTESVDTFLNVIRSEAIKEKFRRAMAPLYEARGIEFMQYRYVPSPTEGEYYKGRGYVYLDFTMTEEAYHAVTQRPIHEMKDWKPHPRQHEYLEKIIALCRERGIRLIFVTAPVSNVYYALMRDYHVFHNYVAGVAEEHGIPFLDLIWANAELQLYEDHHFFDAGHLNGRAVKMTNDYFINWLERQR
jgi:hypothetical protein